MPRSAAGSWTLGARYLAGLRTQWQVAPLRAAGFTLTDLIITMAIMGILAVFAVPNITSWLSAVNMNSTTRSLATELQLTRMRAISRNRKVRVSFDTDNETYEVEEEIDGTWTDLDPEVSGTLPKQIDLYTAPATVTFNPIGTAVGGTITLQNTQGKQKQIIIHTTGRVRIQ